MDRALAAGLPICGAIACFTSQERVIPPVCDSRLSDHRQRYAYFLSGDRRQLPNSGTGITGNYAGPAVIVRWLQRSKAGNLSLTPNDQLSLRGNDVVPGLMKGTTMNLLQTVTVCAILALAYWWFVWR